MPRPLSPMTKTIENYLRDKARGTPPETLLERYFKVDKDSDQKARNKAFQQMWRWDHRPDADAIWQDEIKTMIRRGVPASIDRIIAQVDSDTEWLANKAANDTLNWASRTGVIKTEETALQVNIQGMPDIGSPDDDG